MLQFSPGIQQRVSVDRFAKARGCHVKHVIMRFYFGIAEIPQEESTSKLPLNVTITFHYGSYMAIERWNWLHSIFCSLTTSFHDWIEVSSLRKSCLHSLHCDVRSDCSVNSMRSDPVLILRKINGGVAYWNMRKVQMQKRTKMMCLQTQTVGSYSHLHQQFSYFKITVFWVQVLQRFMSLTNFEPHNPVRSRYHSTLFLSGKTGGVCMQIS